ncbi:MAG: hypothetical protein JW966_07560 [Anaerolineae bacterium]|nr:hypothetical protein [Anaerolineae bacterium]
MAATLRDVLHTFETRRGPLSLNQMARQLDMTPAMLESMLDYWVRKGKLREINDETPPCSACGHATGCPFVMKMPRSYELIQGEPLPHTTNPPCTCCR